MREVSDRLGAESDEPRHVREDVGDGGDDGERPHRPSNSAAVLTVGLSTGWVSICTAARTRRRRHARSASRVNVSSPSGWWKRPSVLKIRLAPTRSAILMRAVTVTTGMPARSISLASVAPLRVPVPHVAVRIAAWMPCAFMSWAISAPMRAIVLMLAMFPVVT